MPKYELMYIIGSQVSDDEVPKIVDEVRSIIEKGGATISKHEDMGRKKLAYPIKKTRNGYYVLVNFEADAANVNAIEDKIRPFQAIIRYIMLNMDEAMVRMEKDRAAQTKLKASRQREAAEMKAAEKGDKKSDVNIDIDAEIEKALTSEDLK